RFAGRFEILRRFRGGIVGDGDVCDSPSPCLILIEDRIPERRPRGFDRHDSLDCLWAFIREQPPEGSGLGMCDNNRGSHLIQQRCTGGLHQCFRLLDATQAFYLTRKKCVENRIPSLTLLFAVAWPLCMLLGLRPKPESFRSRESAFDFRGS